MKKVSLLLLLFVVSLSISKIDAQNVDDNKVSFAYLQLPKRKVDPSIKTYKTVVNHLYKKANEDSLTLYTRRKEESIRKYEAVFQLWAEKKNSLDKDFYIKMAAYEKTINSGATATQPIAPVYPQAPSYPGQEKLNLNSEIVDNDVLKVFKIQGYEQGEGGMLLNVDLFPIRSGRITEKKSGSGATTKYEYYYEYILPIGLTVSGPEGTTYMKQIMFDELKSFFIKSFSSRYEYFAWIIDNSNTYKTEFEKRARETAFSAATNYLNDEFGFVKLTRDTEFYTVKKYKNYDYSDVVVAYTASSQALSLVAKDPNRVTAAPKLDAAIQKWKEILEESNTYDEKARVNDKITAMIHCNLAELYIWRGDFSNADLEINLALNSGVFKFKNQAERLRDFYNAQKNRWEIHY